MNPGPHGPEPYRLPILLCPGGSPDARLNSKCRSLVSVRVPPRSLWFRESVPRRWCILGQRCAQLRDPDGNAADLYAELRPGT